MTMVLVLLVLEVLLHFVWSSRSCTWLALILPPV